MNVVVLRGKLSGPPAVRLLRSGTELASFQVTTRNSHDRADTVPVVWYDPSAAATALDAGAEVVVTGRVRRRFYQVGGARQSQTEVVADSVLLARQASRVSSAVRRALEPVGLVAT